MIEKLVPKGLHSSSSTLKNELPTSQKYFSNILPKSQVEWKEIYLLPRKVSIDNNLLMFQYKILKIVLHLNQQLFIFNEKDAKLCSYCRLQDETINHIFVECKFPIKVWGYLGHYCQCSFDLPILNPQNASFGFFEIDHDLVTLLKPNAAILQVEYLLAKRLFKAFICGPNTMKKKS